MPITMQEHKLFDILLREKNTDKMQELKAEAILELEEVKFWKLAGTEGKHTEKEIDLLIELLVKIEAHEQGKGIWFRFKRRTELLKEYT